MFLVPSDMMSSLHRQKRIDDIEHPYEKLKEDLDENMESILKDKKIPSNDKVTLYNKLLHQLQQLIPQGRSNDKTRHSQEQAPLVVPVTKSTVPTTVSAVATSTDATPKPSGSSDRQTLDFSDSEWYQRILNSVPKKYHHKTDSLLRYMKNNNVLWNKDGNILINNEITPGSNITDIINHTVRARKVKETPPGTKALVKYLKTIKAPPDIIGNKRLWDVHDSERLLSPPTPPQTPLNTRHYKISTSGKKRGNRRQASVQAQQQIKRWIKW